MKEVAEVAVASEVGVVEAREAEAEDSDHTQLPSRKTVMLRPSGHSLPRTSSSITRNPTRKEEIDDKEAKMEEEATRELKAFQ